MNKNLKIALIVGGVVILAASLLLMGAFIGKRVFLNRAVGIERMFGIDRTPNYPVGASGADQNQQGNTNQFYGRGMTGRFSDRQGGRGFGMTSGRMGSDWSRNFAGSCAMDFSRRWFNNTGADTAKNTPSMEQIRDSVGEYLIGLGNPDLAVGEIMRFDNNAYAVILEESTGMGAMELLVDPLTLYVFPEYGPNRMWNTKYGMMAGGMLGFGRGVGCGAGYGPVSLDSENPEINLSKEEAAKIASEYLTANLPDVELEGEGVAFYGYYTFDYQQDGQIAGMLSVNGSSGQIWLHTWHGAFIDEWEATGESK